MTRPSSLKGLRVVGVVTPKGDSGSAGYLRQMLSHLNDGIVSVPLRDAGDTARIQMTAPDEIIEPKGGAGWITDRFTSTGGDDIAQVSFTSGTTGTPKGVVLSRRALHDVVTRLSDAMDLTDKVREYIGVPVNHSFGYGRARAVLHNGGHVYLPPAGFDLSEIRKMLSDGKINALSAVPSLWRVILAAASSFGDERNNLLWIEIGSQMMSADEKVALRNLFPAARIIQHYGLTEASRSTFLQVDGTGPDILGSVGKPTGDTKLAISRDGRIRITGPHVASFILSEVGETDLKSTFETSDLGHIDDQGYLWFEARADDVINCGGIKLNPDAIEAKIRDRVKDAGPFAILRRADPIRGEALALAVTPETTATTDQLQSAALAVAVDMGAAPGRDVPAMTLDSLPRTSTGKLQRHLMTPPSDQTLSGSLGPLANLMGPNTNPADSFITAGGDSLTHLQMQLLLEQNLGAAPMGWEQTPLADLAATIAQGDGADGQTGAPPLPDGSMNRNPSGIGFWALVAEDLRTNDGTLGSQGFWALFVHRFGNWRMGVRPRILRIPFSVLYRILRKAVQILCGIKLDYTVAVGRRVKLEHFGGMMLGARSIGDDTIVRQNTTFGIRTTNDLNAKPVIGARVDVGAGAVIVGNVQIGDDAIIGANSVVYFSVPDRGIVQGVPGKIVGQNLNTTPKDPT
ncbi:AMP-binding protein [Octadecabacter sp. CECT 8868]|uniref:AMP-binding protein n=1 Tax=Octadecabacter algicola TaxID=2909342 RepID=UPI001F491B61|nr:AMP-binding protein [Octadecabacter algicola]MCF2906660.1 AMP-binding protein [Octadecabacter algicola]